MSGEQKWIIVPVGTRASECRGEECRQTIYMVRIGGRPVPVYCDMRGGIRPSKHEKDPLQGTLFGTPDLQEPANDGRGLNHFEDCPNAQQFRRGIGD